MVPLASGFAGAITLCPLGLHCWSLLPFLNEGDCAGMAYIPACGAAGTPAGIHNGLLVFQSYSIAMADPLASAAAVAQLRLNLRIRFLECEFVRRGDGFDNEIPKISVRLVAVTDHELLDVLEQAGEKTESVEHHFGADADHVGAAHHHLNGIEIVAHAAGAEDAGYGADLLADFEDVAKGQRLYPPARETCHRGLDLKPERATAGIVDIELGYRQAIGGSADHTGPVLETGLGDLGNPATLRSKLHEDRHVNGVRNDSGCHAYNLRVLSETGTGLSGVLLLARNL